MSDSEPITFVIPGQRQGTTRSTSDLGGPAGALAGLGGRTRDAVRVGARRAAGDMVRVTEGTSRCRQDWWST